MFGSSGGAFGSSGTGFGTSTPFSSNTAGSSAFGSSGTTFGSGTTNAFGSKPAFGSSSTTTGGFGTSTNAFGAKPSVFGAPAPAPASTFGAPAAGTSAFGRTTSTSPFGAAPAPAAGGFGSTTGAFGTAAAAASPFGAPAPATGLGGFGSTATSSNPFSKPASSPFGAPASAPSTGSVFGAPAPAATSGFGGFGTTSTTSGGLFGAAPASATSAFGAPAPAPTGGLFGSAPATGIGGFGAGTSAFGAAAAAQKGTGNPPWRETRAEDPSGKSAGTPGMLMSISAMKEYEGKSHEELRLEDYSLNRKNNSAVATSKGFGATAAPSTGLFGGFGSTPAPAPAAAGGFSFGSLSTSATPAPATFGGAFGSTPAPAPTGAFGGFGSTPAAAPSTGLFGASTAPAPAFGAPAPAPSTGFGFGASTPAPAPSGFGGLFGSTPAPAPATGAFGAPAPVPSSFSFGGLGSTPAPAPGAFGSSIGGFGTPAPAPAAGAFSFGGSSTGAARPFGAPAPAPAATGFGTTGGLFGSTTPSAAPSTSAFSFKPAATPAPAPGSAFSFASSTKPAFGAPAPATGLFGTPAPAPAAGGGFSFGAPAPAPATSGGGFGGFGSAFGTSTPAPAPTSAFGAPATGGLFGAPAPAPAAGGFFGTTPTQQQQLQHQQQQQQQLQQQQRIAVHNQDPYGSAGNAGFGSGALEQKIKGVENSSQQLSISFERNNTQASGVGGGGESGGGGGGVTQASPSLGFAYRRTPRSNAYIQPRGLGAASAKGAAAQGSSNGSGVPPPWSSSSRLLSEGALTPAGKSGVLSPDVYLSGGVKRLNIPPDTEERRQRFSSARPLIKPNSQNGSAPGAPGSEDGAGTGGRQATTGKASAIAGGGGGDGNGMEEAKGNREESGSGRDSAPADAGDGAGANGSSATAMTSPEGSSRRHTRGGGLASPPPSGGVLGTDVRAAAGGGDEGHVDASPAGNAGRLFAEGHGGSASGPPRLDLPGYATKPPIRKLAAMGDESLRSVHGFEVSRQGYGSIAWKEPVDLRGMDIGQVVAIEHKAASVYDDLPDGQEKPAVGEGLNKPTLVTLFDVFPKGDDPTDAQKTRYEDKVRKITEKMGAKLVDYDVETGVWKFETFHWSRYAIDDDSEDEDESVTGDNGKVGSAKKMPPPPPRDPAARRVRRQTPSAGQRTSAAVPRRSTRYAMPDTDDEGSIADNSSDAGGVTATTASYAGDVNDKASSDSADSRLVGTDLRAKKNVGNKSSISGNSISPDQGSTRPNIFDARDPSQKEYMRTSLFTTEEESRSRVRTFPIDMDVEERRGRASSSSSQAPSPLPPPPLRLALPAPLKAPRPVLRDAEDAEAARDFRPASNDASRSRVLRLLSNAWPTVAAEAKDELKRGELRAGRMVADAGLRHGRGFRASWGPGGKLVCPGSFAGCGVAGAPHRHAVSIHRFDPTPAASGRDDTDALYVAPLRVHQRFAERADADTDADVYGSRAPRWALPRRRSDKPSNYEALVRCMHAYASVHSAAAAADARANGSKAPEDSPEWVLEQSWRLASAMWGQEEGVGKAHDLPIPGEHEAGHRVGGAVECDGASPAARREAAVAHWLANAVASCVPTSRRLQPSSQTSPADGPGEESWRAVLELLSVRRVEDAARVAMAAGLFRLSVVLTAAAATAGAGSGTPGGQQASTLLALQAELWQRAGADARMPQEAVTVYQLLGRAGFRDVGLRGVVSGEVGTSLHPSLDWLRQLGICMWYGAGSSVGTRSGAVAGALKAYEALVAEGEALPPTARYFKEPTHHDNADLDHVCEELRRVHVAEERKLSGGECGTALGRDRCVLSRLLDMYPSTNSGGGGNGGSGASGVALLAALEPMSVSPDVMDYRHSWHLLSVVEALGMAEVPDRGKVAVISEGLRFQLEAAGLWEWAVYVALSAGDDLSRMEATGKELVMRHGFGLLEPVPGSRDFARRELLEELHVPTAWVQEAAAVRSGYEHRSAATKCAPCSDEIETSTITGTADVKSTREMKLEVFMRADSGHVASDAAHEACLLAPGSMYLGGDARDRLALWFEEIRRRLDSGGFGPAGADAESRLSKEFDAYKEIFEAALEAGSSWTREQLDRLERMRRVIEPVAGKIVGNAVAHEALNTVWAEAGIMVL